MNTTAQQTRGGDARVTSDDNDHPMMSAVDRRHTVLIYRPVQ